MFPSKTKTGSKKGFTLIELLIVIVILGILIAALVPRLSGAKARANDTARKADLYQVGVALVAYQMDHAKFPDSATWWQQLSTLSWSIMGVGVNAIPTDPDPQREFDGLGVTITSWEYGYITVNKWWIDNRGFVLMAGSETPWWSNRVTDGTTTWKIDSTTPFETIKLCKVLVASTVVYNGGTWYCTYNTTGDDLRYIYAF